MYLRLVECYEETGRLDDRDRLLQDGIAFFEANVDRFVPQIDDDVARVYNNKARATHNAYREALEHLQRMQAAVSEGMDEGIDDGMDDEGDQSSSDAGD